MEKFEIDASLLRNEMNLPLRIDEAVYLVGALKNHAKTLKQGEEREYILRVLDRLKDLYLDVTSYVKPF